MNTFPMPNLRKIYENLLTYLEHNYEDEKEFHNLIKLFDELQICNNRYEFKMTLRIISAISNNHYRGYYFFTKVYQILNNFKDEIIKQFSNFQILDIFIQNKKLLLFLIKEEILKVDEYFVTTIIAEKYRKLKYPFYFCLEIKPFLHEEKFQDILCGEMRIDDYINDRLPENFEEKREIGENDNEICEIIRDDKLGEFIRYVEENEIQYNDNIEGSIFETNPYLMDEISLIKYAVYFGSIQIYQYLKLKEADTDILLHAAAYSNNPEIIKIIIEEDHCDMDICFRFLENCILCHHNEIADHYREKFSDDFQNKLFDIFLQSIRSYNLHYFPKSFQFKDVEKGRYFFYKMCRYDFDEIVDKMTSLKSSANFINYKKIFFMFFS